MLSKVARRRAHHRDALRQLTASFDQLRLPFLCPAQLRWNSSHPRTAARLALEARIAQTQLPATSPSAHRTLATAATAPTPQVSGSPFFSSDVPRSTLQSQFLANHFGDHFSRPNVSTRNFDEYDPDSSLIINDTTTTADPRLRYRYGVGGGPAELVSNLHASLRVGRFDRAAVLLRRLFMIYDASAPEMIETHNLYLVTVIESLVKNPSEQGLHDVQKWFELEMFEKGIPIDATTIVTLLRGALQILQGSKRDRTIRRYVTMAEKTGVDVLEDPISCSDLTDAEWAIVSNVCPSTFEAPPSDLVDEAEARIGQQNNNDETAVRLETIDASSPLAVPEVKETLQKGLGLKYLKQSLSLFNENSNFILPKEDFATEEERQNATAYLRQIRLEEDGVEAAIERWRIENEKMQKVGINPAMKKDSLQSMLWDWHQSLMKAIEAELVVIRQQLANPAEFGTTDEAAYGPYLEAIPPRTVAALTIMNFITNVGDVDNHGAEAGVKVNKYTTLLARALEEETKFIDMSRPALYTATGNQRRNNVAAKLRKSHTSRAGPAKNQNASSGLLQQSYEWTSPIRYKLAAMLASKLIEIAKVPVKSTTESGKAITTWEPALRQESQFARGRRVGLILAHPEITKRLTSEPAAHLITKRLPMVVEPKRWSDFETGGYLRYPVPFIRVKANDDFQIQYAKAAAERGDLKDVFAALDVLGKTPWKINRKVFEVMVKVWNSGEKVGKLAPADPEFDYPPELPANANIQEKIQWRRRVQEINNIKAGIHSDRCFQNFQMDIARAYLNETFYFPHNLDFRGRAYPIPPYLNHMGADNARGILMFANGRELGATGLRWLQIHLANLYGFDKASLKDRENFAMEHLDDIKDSVANPLGGRRWWTKAEDPWQLLGACFELVSALESPDPTKYVSHLPVHQDGTCNGLQHYAALGGDLIGARQVNLEPGDKPSDIYSGVAELVKQLMREDAEKGDELAKFLEPRIVRKIVKQPVMTNVYGVTFIGAKDQVEKQVEALIPAEAYGDRWRRPDLALYITKKIFQALGQMFNGATAIQEWLAECARRISVALSAEQVAKLIESGGKVVDKRKKRREKDSAPTDFRSCVIWTTPLKMPVVQPYRDSRAAIIHTKLQTLSIIEPRRWDPIDKRKQLQAFAPNFVHSLDATHMMLSALKSSELGLDFAAVHDSFWTHAADIDKMNLVLRDAFVMMHKEDVIGRLKAEFEVRYKGFYMLRPVYFKTPLGKQLLESKFRIVRNTPRNQEKWLIQEIKRQKLLNSTVPEERAEGEAMVTPTKLAEEAAAEDWLFPGGKEAAPEDAVATLDAIGTDAEFVENLLKDITTGDSEAGDVVEELEDSEELSEPVMGKEALAGETAALAHGEQATKSAAKKKKRPLDKFFVWMPIEIPALPKRGDWDVTRLKESKYFFS